VANGDEAVTTTTKEDVNVDVAEVPQPPGLPPSQEQEEEGAAEAAAAVEEELIDPIWELNDMDVLSGRGASVNNHPGNKKFRALCFVRKPLFDAGNHAAKRRIATEIVSIMMRPTEEGVNPSRFLKKRSDKGPYFAMTEEQAIMKAQQVMRDYKRPDRIAIREALEQSGQVRKRARSTVSTPLDEVRYFVPLFV
jgi:hypothetical protein